MRIGRGRPRSPRAQRPPSTRDIANRPDSRITRMSVHFKSHTIETLLKCPDKECANRPQRVKDLCFFPDGSCDVAFALFLEPDLTQNSHIGWPEWFVDSVVKACQPSPVFVHCEIVIPPLTQDGGSHTQFATYMGRRSGWQTDRIDGFGYYLVDKSNKWRAVPIFGKRFASRLRNEANSELGVEYSLARYLTSCFPLRCLSHLVPAGRRKPAHCATLTARVIKNALPATPLSHNCAWYGPSTLYSELCSNAAAFSSSVACYETPVGNISVESERNIDELLRRPMTHDTIHGVGDKGCVQVVRLLAIRVTDALVAGDAASQRTTQKQLATAILRWVLLRKDTAER